MKIFSACRRGLFSVYSFLLYFGENRRKSAEIFFILEENMISRLRQLRFSVLFFLFFFGSIIGFILEGLWCILKRGHWENHSATVFGPFCIIYGLGMVAFYLLSIFINRKNIFIQYGNFDLLISEKFYFLIPEKL